jgi:uncharacterized protein
MRTYDVVVSLSLVGFAFGALPATAFDGTRTPEAAPVTVPLPPTRSPNPGRPTPPATIPTAPLGAAPVTAPQAAMPPTPFQALRSGIQALRAGHTDQAVTALEYAAEQGVPDAQWKLGRMYADGDGVDKNKLRSFEYYKRLTSSHADDPPGTVQARFVASAFVGLAHFYLDGIPDTAVKADPNRARELYQYAASYFGDADAQYYLGRLYLAGKGAPRDPMQAARWFRLAANKGQPSAQAMLGSMLVKGDAVVRQAAVGLFWLTLAKDSAGPGESWIADTYASAFAKASDDERALALRYLEDWLKTRRE